MQTTTAMPARPSGPAMPRLKGRPLIGSLREFGRDALGLADVGWKRCGDLFALPLGIRTLYVVSHPDLAQAVLIEGKNIYQRSKAFEGGTPLTYVLGLSLLTTDGESWLARRRLMQPIFHRQRIQGMGDQMTAAGQRLLARWDALPANAQVDLSREMKHVTLDIINRTMFGVDVLPEIDKIGESVDVGLHYIAGRIRTPIRLPSSWPTPANRRLRAARSLLDGYLYRVIDQRRASGEHPGDLLDMLLEARDEDTGLGMDDLQIRNEVASIYGAGHETTAVALSWTWYALNQNPVVLRRLQAELDKVLGGQAPTAADLPRLPYALMVLEEAMRLYPPVPFTARTAVGDARLGGFDIPKGGVVLLAINNLHRHPDFWEEPEAFRPERFTPEAKAARNKLAYMPFLSGPHLCIGNNFALMEGQLLLATMAQRYEPTLISKAPPERDVAVTMRPKGGLPVRLVRRPTPKGDR
ncbi:MAG: cytochrome P450 [Anaerolineales bacterium]